MSAIAERPIDALAGALKSVLRAMPGPVALITAHDAAGGGPSGLAASAVIPCCLEPPSMLVCVNRAASAHAVIERTGRFCINIVGPAEAALVGDFSDSARRAHRFADRGWSERHCLAYLPSAAASLFCTVRTTLLFGTHEAFVGEVFDVATSGAVPGCWMDGGFATCAPLAPTSPGTSRGARRHGGHAS